MILVDAGLSGKKTTELLECNGLDIEEISAILLTHEHEDHVSGAGVLARMSGAPIYATRLTHLYCRGMGKVERRCFSPLRTFSVGEIVFHPFPVSHDAIDPIGFIISNDGTKIGILTDLGIMTLEIIKYLQSCATVILESNYDPDMLWDGPYPSHLKKRIAGPWGHLSNREAAETAAVLTTGSLKNLILAHLSGNNNTEMTALDAIVRKLEERNLFLERLEVAPRDELGPVFHDL